MNLLEASPYIWEAYTLPALDLFKSWRHHEDEHEPDWGCDGNHRVNQYT